MRKEANVPLAPASVAVALSVLIASLLVIAVAAQEEEEEVMVEEEIVPEESAGVTPDSPIYIFDKIVDDVQLALAKGDDKTKKALEIKEERIAEAAVMVGKNKPDQAKSALELATKAAEQAQKELDPEFEKETNEKVRRAAKLLSGLQEKLPDQGWEGVEKALDAQLSEEEKVRVALLVSKSRLTYCDAIAQQDFDLMKADELCQVEKAPQWLKERVGGEFKAREEKARGLIIDTVSTCVLDPKKCDCSQIPVSKHSQSCEVKKALAIRCEYENDESACSELASEKLEDFLPEFIGEEGKQTVLAHLREKEQEMFEKFKPPECAAVSDFRECFAVMKDLYGTPPECEGLSDDECMELMKSKGPESEEERMQNFPPECKEAGVTTPLECAEIMFSKYGKPPQCEGLDTKECMKLMRHERPDAANFAMPKECQDAGAKEPRQCFDIMTSKFGMPPECEGLSSDDCFKEMMKRGPGEGPQGGGGQEEQPECREKGLKGKDCFIAMTELYGGLPQQCEGLSSDECYEKVMREGPPKGEPPVRCVGLSPEECKAKIQEHQGLPPECAQNPDKCQNAFEGRGVPGGIPAECAGLEPEQCELVMMQKFGPPECKEATKDECEAIMKEKYGTEGGGLGGGGGSPGPGSEGGFRAGGFGGTGEGGFVNECEGLPREECDKKMFERFKPPECEGVAIEECRKGMAERFEKERQERGEAGGGFRGEEGRGGSGIPTECQGLSAEDCRSKFFEGEHREGSGSGAPFTGEFPREGEAGGGTEGGEGARPSGLPLERQGPGPQRIERVPLGEPERREQQQQPYPAREYPAQSYPKPEGDYQRDYPQQQYPSEGGGYPGTSGSYPSGDREGSGSGGGYQPGGSGYPSGGEGGSTSDSSGSPSGDSSGGGGGGEGGGEGTAAAITGQIVNVLKWIGGR